MAVVKRPGRANQLELAIIDGAIAAQKTYAEITGGWWLWHGPESYLQTMIANHIAEQTKRTVYVDCSIKKLRSGFARGPGRPAHNHGQRPDISIWNKSNERLHAAIEIKRAWSITGLRGDAQKLARWLAQAHAPGTAYLLAYSETKGKNRQATLDQRFRRWSKTLGWKLVCSCADPDGDGEWSWGFCVLRAPRPA